LLGGQATAICKIWCYGGKSSLGEVEKKIGGLLRRRNTLGLPHQGKNRGGYTALKSPGGERDRGRMKVLGTTGDHRRGTSTGVGFSSEAQIKVSNWEKEAERKKGATRRLVCELLMYWAARRSNRARRITADKVGTLPAARGRHQVRA